MRIGVLGSGDVGQTLGAAFATVGHDVRMGTRDPQQPKAQAWATKAGPNASTGTFADAAAFGELLVLATLWSASAHVIQLAKSENAARKIVIDATNPLDFSSGGPKLAVGHSDSGGEQVQRWLPTAHVVKAFNIVGHAHMFRPAFPGGPPDMFICGNNSDAKHTVGGLLHDFGWSVIDLGGIELARYLEPLAMVWVHHYFNTKSVNHAFKLLRK
jgi:predicted dinucleotide-binding enzyme